jgi:hypothetical protein
MSYSTLYDTIVCGGGTSGVAAAIASARGGAKTLLVERIGTLGGQMNVSGPPGFAYARLHNHKGERDIGGIVQETYERLYRSGHALPHYGSQVRMRGSYTFEYVDPDWWTALIFEMMEEESVELLLDTLVVGVIKDGDKVGGIVVENANGRNEIKGKIVIDCTGEGYVSIQANCEMAVTPKEKIQPHTLAFTVDGVDWDKLLRYIRSHPEQFSYKQLMYPYEDRNTEEDIREMYRRCYDIRELGEVMGFYELRDIAFANGDWHPYSGAGFFLTPKEGGHIQAHFQHSSQVGQLSPTDAWDLTKCMIECRKQNMIAWRFFKGYVPGFENAYITKVCTELRLREGPRIVGDYVLTKEDVYETRQFPDTLGKSSFKAGGYHVASMDTLNICADDKADMTITKDGGSYDIPYRCLVPKVIDNLLAAGKCVSTDRAAYLRYLHQTMVTGQAAGAAAALCVKKNITPRQLENQVKDLQDILVKQGAILFETVKDTAKCVI